MTDRQFAVLGMQVVALILVLALYVWAFFNAVPLVESDSGKSPIQTLNASESGSLCGIGAEVNTSSLVDDERVIVEGKGIAAVFRQGDEGQVYLSRVAPGTEVVAYSVTLSTESATVHRRHTITDECSLS